MQKKKTKTVLFSLVLHMVGPSAQVLVSVSAWPVGSITNGHRRVWELDVKNPSTSADLRFFRAKTPHWLEITDLSD